MPTGEQVVNDTFKRMGLVEAGGNINVSDMNDAIDQLNVMWQDYSIDEGLIYAQVHKRFPLANSAASYQLGPGAQFDSPIPSRIYKAYFIQVNGGNITAANVQDGGLGYVVGDTGIIIDGSGVPATYQVATIVALTGVVLTINITSGGTGYIPQRGYQTQKGGGQPGSGSGLTISVTAVPPTGQNRNEIKVVNANQYYSHGDLNALSMTPDELYPDFNPDDDGFIRLYLWPILTIGPATLELVQAVIFKTWTVTDNYNITAGTLGDIQWALAFRLLSTYGTAVQPQIAEQITANATKAELRLRQANRINRQLPIGAEMLVPPEEQQATK